MALVGASQVTVPGAVKAALARYYRTTGADEETEESQVLLAMRASAVLNSLNRAAKLTL